MTFLALRLAVGDPTYNLLSQGLATARQAEELRHALGFDLPIWNQYLRFLGELLHGQLGLSLYTSRPVTRVIAEQAPFTFSLALTGLGLAILLGFLLGTTAAWWEHRFIGSAASFLTNLSTSIPVSFIGLLLLYFGLRFAALGLASSGIDGILLPACVLGIASAGPIGRVVRSGLTDSLHAPYILAARARGLRHGVRLLWHAFRPALPPVISLTTLEAAYLFGGTVVTETVFARPGLGRLLIKAILEGDYPIAQGLVVLAAFLYIASQLSADIAALILDPRTHRA